VATGRILAASVRSMRQIDADEVRGRDNPVD